MAGFSDYRVGLYHTTQSIDSSRRSLPHFRIDAVLQQLLSLLMQRLTTTTRTATKIRLALAQQEPQHLFLFYYDVLPFCCLCLPTGSWDMLLVGRQQALMDDLGLCLWLAVWSCALVTLVGTTKRYTRTRALRVIFLLLLLVGLVLAFVLIQMLQYEYEYGYSC